MKKGCCSEIAMATAEEGEEAAFSKARTTVVVDLPAEEANPKKQKPPFRPAKDDTKPLLRDPILRSDPIETEQAVLRLPPFPRTKLQSGSSSGMARGGSQDPPRTSGSTDPVERILALMETHRKQAETHRKQAEDRSMDIQRQLDALTQIVSSLVANKATTVATNPTGTPDIGAVDGDEPQPAYMKSSFKPKDFLDANPPEFEGRTSPDKVMDWIEKMECLFAFLGVPSSKKVACAGLQLRLRANNWWKAKKPELLATARDGKISWTMFKKAFLEQYIPLAISQEMEDEFMALKQGSMSVEDYESEFSKLAMFAGPMIPTEKARMNRFIKGLNDDIRLNVMNRECESYVIAFEAAIQIEQFRLRSAPVKNQDYRNPSAKRYHDGEKKTDGEQNHRSECNFYDKKGHTREKCHIANRECFNCGQKGHISWNCQNKRPTPQNRNENTGHGQNQGPPSIRDNPQTEQLRRPRVYNMMTMEQEHDLSIGRVGGV